MTRLRDPIVPRNPQNEALTKAAWVESGLNLRGRLSHGEAASALNAESGTLLHSYHRGLCGVCVTVVEQVTKDVATRRQRHLYRLAPTCRAAGIEPLIPAEIVVIRLPFSDQSDPVERRASGRRQP